MKFERRYSFTARKDVLYLRVGMTLYPSLWSFLWWQVQEARRAIAQVYRERDIALGGCENCGSFWRLDWRGPWTCYHWDGTGEDPNRKQWFCEPCGLEADDYWGAMWDEYRRSQG